MKCKDCGGPTIALLTSTVCERECDIGRENFRELESVREIAKRKQRRTYDPQKARVFFDGKEVIDPTDFVFDTLASAEKIPYTQDGLATKRKRREQLLRAAYTPDGLETFYGSVPSCSDCGAELTPIDPTVGAYLNCLCYRID